MIADLKPYAEYKESGVEWLGNMPEHWGMRRLKGVVDPSRPITYGIVQCGEHVPDGIPYIRPVDMREDGSVSLNMLKRTSREIAVSYRRSEVRGGDVVVSIGPSFGKVMVVPDGLTGANLTQGTARIAPGQAASAEFLLWLVRSQAMHRSMAAVATGSTFLALNLEPLGRIRVPLPPPAEQAAIVRFLDWANGRLERTIRAKRKVIALLEEQKQAIIHRAISRGLDPSVPLKPSGIPWLGDIPQHWEVRKLRQLLARVTERNCPDLPLLSVVREMGVIKRDTEDRDGNHNFIPDDLSNYKVVRCGQVAMNKMKAWQGSYGVSEIDGIVSPAYFVFDLGEVGGAFFHTAIRSKAYVPFFAQASDGVRVGQWDLTESRMKEISFFFPPVDEQVAIVQFVARATSGISVAISRLEREIELLREYRTRLVADVVTGKLDVREAAARLPDEAPLDSVEDDADLSPETETADEEAAV